MLFPTSQADIQKNTLQVKVGIKAPPPVLKPDMLVQVTFLAPPGNGEAASGERLRVLVPRQLLESAAGGTHIWVADQVGRTARLRAIKLGLGMQGDLIEVADEAHPFRLTTSPARNFLNSTFAETPVSKEKEGRPLLLLRD